MTESFADASEYGVVQQAQMIEVFLRDGGYETISYALDDAGEAINFLTRERPDLIFNCCESFRGNAMLEINVAALFEILGIPFTGSSALTLGMALDKSIAKALFKSYGVPTPAWAVLSPHRFDGADRLRFPVIVKPLNQDSSIGIDTHSIVEEQASLMERVRFVWDEFRQPSLAEEFIDGRELNVAVLAVAPEQFVTLPISEIVFRGLPDRKHHILTYEAKWIMTSSYYRSTLPRCPAELTPELAEQVRSIALNAAAAVRLRDYGRIDFRIRASDGKVFVLEANPNPDLTIDSGFVKAAQASGQTHASVIHEIVERAKERALGRYPG